MVASNFAGMSVTFLAVFTPEGTRRINVSVNVAIQAHRGSPDPSGGISENTLEAFARARRLGADGVELDVRLTADGALAVYHDPNIPGVGRVVGAPPGQPPSRPRGYS